jgi:hypothetical protein
VDSLEGVDLIIMPINVAVEHNAMQEVGVVELVAKEEMQGVILV